MLTRLTSLFYPPPLCIPSLHPSLLPFIPLSSRVINWMFNSWGWTGHCCGWTHTGHADTHTQRQRKTSVSAMGWKRARGSFEVEKAVKGREESVEREGEQEGRQSERDNKIAKLGKMDRTKSMWLFIKTKGKGRKKGSEGRNKDWAKKSNKSTITKIRKSCSEKNINSVLFWFLILPDPKVWPLVEPSMVLITAALQPTLITPLCSLLLPCPPLLSPDTLPCTHTLSVLLSLPPDLPPSAYLIRPHHHPLFAFIPTKLQSRSAPVVIFFFFNLSAFSFMRIEHQHMTALTPYLYYFFCLLMVIEGTSGLTFVPSKVSVRLIVSFIIEALVL